MKKVYFLILFFISSLYGSGLQFLRINPFSISSGMGEAFTGISGYDSIYYNPAGYVSLKKGKSFLSVGYTSWVENTTKSSVLYIPSWSMFLKAVSVDYFTISGLKEYNSSGGEIGSLNYNDTAVTFNIGAKVSIFDLGLNLKIINEKISSYSGNGYGLDAGLIFPFSKQIKIGVSYLNSGTFNLKVDEEKIKIDLPQTLRAGVSYQKENFLFDIDWERADSESILHFGGEIKFQDKYFIRAGYQAGSTNKGLSFGIGVESQIGGRNSWGSWSGKSIRRRKGSIIIFNYSYTPFSELETSIHRFDIGLKF